MALILDHVNGVADDNRLENLRIVCPNCAATLDTHCGRNKIKRCEGCRTNFRPTFSRQRYCCVACHKRALHGVGRPANRKRKRPPYAQLLAELAASSYRAVSRKYGVSDNTLRKWVRQYKREQMRRAVRTGRMCGRVTTVRSLVS
jgi:transposase-like protein